MLRFRTAEYENEVNLSEKQAELIAFYKYAKEVENIEMTTEGIIDKKVKISPDGIEGRFVCEENIAEEREIGVAKGD